MTQERLPRGVRVPTAFLLLKDCQERTNTFVYELRRFDKRYVVSVIGSVLCRRSISGYDFSDLPYANPTPT